jgi:hypothetical protein
MERTRKKETELNPNAPGGIGRKKYGPDSRIDTKGSKGKPTSEELDWFNDLVGNSGWQPGGEMNIDGSTGVSG